MPASADAVEDARCMGGSGVRRATGLGSGAPRPEGAGPPPRVLAQSMRPVSCITTNRVRMEKTVMVIPV